MKNFFVKLKDVFSKAMLAYGEATMFEHGIYLPDLYKDQEPKP